MPWTSADSNAQKYVKIMEEKIKANAHRLAVGMTENNSRGLPKAFDILDALAWTVDLSKE